MTTIYRIELPYACFAVTVRDGVCTEAAPIGRWMVGKSYSKIREWVVRKQGTILELNPDRWADVAFKARERWFRENPY